MNTKIWFATDIKTILFFVHHKNYGRIEIVGIWLARLKYMTGSENVYMQIIGVVAKKIYIKNNNLCKTIFIILVNHSFLLGINTNVSYLQQITFKIKELMCI